MDAILGFAGFSFLHFLVPLFNWASLIWEAAARFFCSFVAASHQPSPLFFQLPFFSEQANGQFCSATPPAGRFHTGCFLFPNFPSFFVSFACHRLSITSFLMIKGGTTNFSPPFS